MEKKLKIAIIIIIAICIIIPISVVAYNNYQYKAFGIPWLGLKRGLADEIVVSSYGTMLALSEAPEDVIDNIKRVMAIVRKYGFSATAKYEGAKISVD